LRVRSPALKKRRPSTQTAITGITCGVPSGRTVANQYVAVDSCRYPRAFAHVVGVVASGTSSVRAYHGSGSGKRTMGWADRGS
jgi:hypothetical protein